MATSAEKAAIWQDQIDAGAVNDAAKAAADIVATLAVLQTADATQAAAPAGGTGATGGAYDTAPHRDSLIALVNQMRTALITAKLIKGGA